MSSPASIKGHPIHPMLIAFPIGLWVFSLVCDLVFKFWSTNPVWTDVAFYTLAGGIVGALLAAVPGLIDLLSIKDPRVMKIGISHMIINLVAVAVFSLDLWLRTGLQTGVLPTLPFALSIFGNLLISASGWLGGEMVYRFGVAVKPQQDTPADQRAKARVSGDEAPASGFNAH